MEEIIGNKEEFAIEFKIINESQFTGYSKLWLQGNLLGAPGELIYFESYLFNLLDQFCNSKVIDSKWLVGSNFMIFKMLKKYTYEIESNSFNASPYACLSSSFTDDFYVFSYNDNGVIHILWRVRKNAFYKEVKTLGGRLFHFKMEQSEFCNLIDRYKSYIKNFVKT